MSYFYIIFNWLSQCEDGIVWHAKKETERRRKISRQEVCVVSLTLGLWYEGCEKFNSFLFIALLCNVTCRNKIQKTHIYLVWDVMGPHVYKHKLSFLALWQRVNRQHTISFLQCISQLVVIAKAKHPYYCSYLWLTCILMLFFCETQKGKCLRKSPSRGLEQSSSKMAKGHH